MQAKTFIRISVEEMDNNAKKIMLKPSEINGGN